MRNWWLSVVLLFGYVAVFHVWAWTSNRGVVVVSAVGTCALLAALCYQCRSYFVNGWDAFGHGALIADAAVEGSLIPVHDDRGFYLCAVGFAAVVGGYRALQLHRRRPGHTGMT